jgi:muramoyltetrapeptide carboxypeptidase LdcA involved in peptidoglycan recycling
MILPYKINKGDTIGIFSPSYPASAAWTGNTSGDVSFLKEKGFNIKFGSLTGKRDFYRSGSIRERAAELNELIASPDVKCIMAVAGGYVSNSLLPYIDYEYLRGNPKIIIGFSDVTAILLAIYAKTGLITYYGPVLSCFGRKPPVHYETYNYMNSIICEPHEIPYTFPVPAYWTEDYIDADEDIEYTMYENNMVALNSGVSEGRLIACNLNTLMGFMASEYMPKIEKGDILLIEDKFLDAETAEREFSMLKVNGIFDKIGGLIIGKQIDFNDCGTGKKHYEILQEVMGEVNFPILAEFDCSHSMPMLTVPIGCKIRLDATKKQVTLLESWVK